MDKEIIGRPRKWISKEEAKKLFPSNSTYHKPIDTQTNTSIAFLQKREKLSYKQAKELYDSFPKE